MPEHTTAPRYVTRRDEVETYFDRTAAETWRRLTSDEPVSGIRATVRAGRDRMRETLLSWLPQDLTGRRVLDAGCGTGAFAIAAARRGADVVAIDLSPNLVDIARDRAKTLGAPAIDFRSGDMLDSSLGQFDHIVAMDVLIHYAAPEMVKMVGSLAAMSRRSVMFTVAPRTPMLSAMHAAGRLFPRADRAPRIEPIAQRYLARLVASSPSLANWELRQSARITSGFYMSQAQELVLT